METSLAKVAFQLFPAIDRGPWHPGAGTKTQMQVEQETYYAAFTSAKVGVSDTLSWKRAKGIIL